jgi:AcrR family transcriptional regulator
MGPSSVPGSITDAARALFAARGYGSTSLQEVAEAAGCSKAALYRHFPNKDALLFAMGRPFVLDVDSVLGTVSLDLSAAEDRVSVIRAYMLALAKHREVAKVLLLDSGTRASGVGQQVLDQQRRLAARLAGQRAPFRQQVRTRCAISIAHLMVGDLSGVPVHRLRGPLFEAVIDTLVLNPEDADATALAIRLRKPPSPMSAR